MLGAKASSSTYSGTASDSAAVCDEAGEGGGGMAGAGAGAGASSVVCGKEGLVRKAKKKEMLFENSMKILCLWSGFERSEFGSRLWNN